MFLGEETRNELIKFGDDNNNMRSNFAAKMLWQPLGDQFFFLTRKRSRDELGQTWVDQEIGLHSLDIYY